MLKKQEPYVISQIGDDAFYADAYATVPASSHPIDRSPNQKHFAADGARLEPRPSVDASDLS